MLEAGIGCCAAIASKMPGRQPLTQSVLIYQVCEGLLANESAEGFRRLLPESRAISSPEPALQGRVRACVVPACHKLTPGICSELKAYCQTGAAVFLESALGFFADSSLFDKQAELLNQHFGLIYRQPAQYTQTYLHLHWPISAHVRPFGPVCAVAGGEAIGEINSLSVVQRVHIGSGTLVFSSSPLGPHLLAGDRQANAWATALFTNTQQVQMPSVKGIT